MAGGDFAGFMSSLSLSDGERDHLTISSWTDELNPCESTGVGFAENQKYYTNGFRNREHGNEDTYFNFKLDENTRLYGVFDGHCGAACAAYARSCLSGHVLLEQEQDSGNPSLKNARSEEDVYEILRQAYTLFDRQYFETVIGDTIAQREAILSQPDELCDDNWEMQMKELDARVGSGTTAAIVLLFRGKLYSSNSGDSRALLCSSSPNGSMVVTQLSVDHDIKNDDEIKRLKSLNVDVANLRQLEESGLNVYTRCLGNYLVKGGYHHSAPFASATSEPVIPTPEVHEAVELDSSHRFLLIFSHGVCKALQDVSNGGSVNTTLARMVVEEFRTQTSLNDVAQAVIDKICRIHQNHFSSTNSVKKRDDMTLLVRNFNFPLPNSISPVKSISTPPTSSSSEEAPPVATTVTSPTPNNVQDTLRPTTTTTSRTATNATGTDSSSTANSISFIPNKNRKFSLDEEGRIKPYISFETYYKNHPSAPKSDEKDSNS